MSVCRFVSVFVCFRQSQIVTRPAEAEPVLCDLCLTSQSVSEIKLNELKVSVETQNDYLRVSVLFLRVFSSPNELIFMFFVFFAR